ncbi:NRDE family protein [Nocardia sp. XZ_19_385]|uniref:NRDE family protein n=1 Tax=Nocardia sp. XZ_19_385 TaxID=2769488 RepID=UPI00188DE6C9|nr:NRDE family protein [Nocardia sp. XZ_19_385]
MCLVLLGWRVHPEYRLIVAANRDEFYTRPAEPMRWWPEVPGVLAGRDLGARGGIGTWLGLATAAGRFAGVTNVRNPKGERADARSRGSLLMDYLRGDQDLRGPGKYLHDVAAGPDDYNGYHVVASDLATLWWHSNGRPGEPRELAPGFHGLSNGPSLASAAPGPAAELIAPDPIWPKVRDGVDGLRKVVESEPAAVDRYFEVLADRTAAPDDQLPDTGIPRDLERAASARFVSHLAHGTRASTVLLMREDGTFEMAERTFGRLGRPKGKVAFSGTVDLPD